jgi:hypothetical protein
MHPRDVALGPLRAAVAIDPAVTQQLLGDAVTRRRSGATQIVTAAHQIAQPLSLLVGRSDEAQLTGPVETHELGGVATVGLDAITGANGNQRRGDHIAPHTDPRQQPQQVKPARPGLIGDRQPVRATEPTDQPPNRPLGRLDALHLRLAAGRRQRRRDDRELVDIERDPQTHIRGRVRANVRHGLVLHEIRLRHWRPPVIDSPRR